MAAYTLPIELGHSMPPEGPHTITVHLPGWQTSMQFRDGDANLVAKLRSVYPRFSPFGLTNQLSTAIGEKLHVSEMTSVLLYTDPHVFAVHNEYGHSHHRKENQLNKGDLSFYVVDVHGVRLYVVAAPAAKRKGFMGVWQNTGLGFSSRTAEELLKHIDEVEIVNWSGDLNDIPEPTYLPGCDAAEKLKERIASLLNRASIDPGKARAVPGDVYLYQNGMAAIYRANQVLLERKPGKIAVFGSLFHNTWHLLEETTDGLKHFVPCDARSGVVEEFEAYLESESKEGRTISYLFLEFPSNPILVSADVKKLRQLATKYAFPLVVDDTIGSFSNLDLLPDVDILISSCTKSFSGYANVMTGSAVLSSLSPLYHELKPIFESRFRNEYFSGDAEQLLANSADYLARTKILNRNAAALASYLQTQAHDPESPVMAVLYPTTSATRKNYEMFLRRPTEELTPGYGCLLSVDFKTLDSATAFYNNLEVTHGPHLGAHLSLAAPFNALVFGRDPDEAKYHASYGAREEQVRISVGLEEEEDLLARVRYALEKAEEAFRG